ncbi:MAG: hypothetical protein WAQ08_10860 [Aquabacterium sp.]|uniref:hypothetical protein n=1 Tax=Aquabacterium sp. TaxID=1872578 RepID=UPI003BB1C76E
MSMQSENNWYQNGLSSGNRPDNTTSDREWEKYDEGKSARDFNRSIDETMKRIEDNNNSKG